jgi:hypothetical protein
MGKMSQRKIKFLQRNMHGVLKNWKKIGDIDSDTGT